MQVFEFIIVLVVIVFGANLIRTKMSHQTKSKVSEDGLKEQLDALGVADQLKKVDALEQRVRVLEKLATDKRGHLADEIDRL